MDDHQGARRNEEVHVETTEASGGSREGVVRWVLIIGTLLAVVLLGSVFLFGAGSQTEAESEISVSNDIANAEDDSSDTDGVLIDDADTIESADDDAPGTTLEN